MAGCASSTASTSAGIDVLAAPHDAVRAAVDDDKAAVLVEPAEIAGPHRCVRRERRLAEVPRAPGRAGDDDLAHAIQARVVDADGHAGESRPAVPGASAACADGSAVTPEPISEGRTS